MIPDSPAEEHRSIAATFGERVAGVAPDAWDGPTPVVEWRVRDIVAHLVEWFPPFLAAGCDLQLTPGPDVADDPVSAWQHHAAQVQAVLDDPANTAITFSHPHLPAMPLPQAIAQFYTGDVFMHTWDLARATGQPDRLDDDRARTMTEGMEPMDQMLRQSGQYGPRIIVTPDADWTDRLMGFIGRDPSWLPLPDLD